MASVSFASAPHASAHYAPASRLGKPTDWDSSLAFSPSPLGKSSFRGKALRLASGAASSRLNMSADVEPGEKKVRDLREEEKFAVLDTGMWECNSCGYVYDQAKGDPSYPIAPGLDFKQLPEDWRCPTCGAAQSFFGSKSREVAGFAQNQSYGLGGNSLTSDQKSLLIYGSLLFFFFLFLSGYFLN